MYDDLHPKWIIEDGCLVIGKVIFHKDLAWTEDAPIGGGSWHLDRETKTFHLFGESEKYKSCTLEQVTDCVLSNKVGTMTIEDRFKDYHFTFSNYHGIDSHMLFCVTIN